MKYKKIMFLIISLILFINVNRVLAEDNTNIGSVADKFGTTDFDQRTWDMWQPASPISIAKISLWDQDTNEIIDNFIVSNYDGLDELRLVTKYNKIDYINLNGKIDKDISVSLEYKNQYIYLENLITIEDFPQLLLKDERVDIYGKIQAYFNDREKLKTLLQTFNDVDINNKATLLIEPMGIFEVNKGRDLIETGSIEDINNTKTLLLLSSAEIGLIEYNNHPIFDNSIDYNENYTGLINTYTFRDFYYNQLYKVIPFTTFKTDIEKLHKVKPCPDKYKGSWNATGKDGFYDMIESLGCFEVYYNFDGEQVVEATKSEITRSTDLIYYTNSWVITSVNVSSVKGFPYQSKTPGTAEDRSAKNNCLSGNGKAKITYNFDTDVEYYNNSNVNEIAIPENGNAVSWLKWKCPDEECYIQIEIKTNSEDAIPDINVINIQVIDPITNKYPPNTEATDRNDYFTQPNVAYGDWKISDNKSMEWITYDYEWHYDWHYICRNSYNNYECLNEINENEYNQYGSSGGYSLVEEETNSGKTRLVRDYWHVCNACSCNFVDVGENHKCKICNFNKEDWGWVEWKERKHEITISAKNPILKRSKNSPNSNDSDTSIKSGYGIEFSINTNIKYTNNNIRQNLSEAKDMVVPLQFMEVFLPEYYYEEYEITTFNDLDENGYKEENIFTLPKNPYSQFEQNCHFTPIWYPDGKYVIGVKLNKCYCPGGELNICYDDIYISINGNAYDDWHIAPK